MVLVAPIVWGSIKNSAIITIKNSDNPIMLWHYDVIITAKQFKYFSDIINRNGFISAVSLPRGCQRSRFWTHEKSFYHDSKCDSV